MLITHRDPVIVSINGRFDWDSFANGLGRCLSVRENLLQDKIQSNRNTHGFVCRINFCRITDILNWDSDRISLCEFLSQCEINIKNTHITIILDSNIPQNEMRWESHWEGTNL